MLLFCFSTIQEHTNFFQLFIHIHDVDTKSIIFITYVSLFIHFVLLSSEVLISCELHVVNCLSADIFIDMNVLCSLKSDISINTIDIIHFCDFLNSLIFSLLTSIFETYAWSSSHHIISCFWVFFDLFKYVSNSSIAHSFLTKAISVWVMRTHIISQDHEKIISVHHSDINTFSFF